MQSTAMIVEQPSKSDSAARSRRIAVFVAVMAAAGLTACSDVQAPADDAIDANRIIADHELLGSLIDGAAANSFAALGGRLPTLGGPAATFDATASGSVPLISETNRGVTFVYDASLDTYVPDPTLTGAPANGVRFILYETIEERPDPSREIGYADLIDSGTTANNDIVLRFVAVKDGATFLDYGFTVSATDGQASAVIDGFLQDPENRLDFAIDLAGTDFGGTKTFDLGFDMAIAAREFTIEGGLTGEERADGSSHDVDLTVRHGDDSIRVDGSAINSQIDAGFYLNGSLFATARGGENAPEILNANGDPLRPIEVVALVQVLRVTSAVFMLVECLGEPVEGLIGLALAL